MSLLLIMLSSTVYAENFKLYSNGNLVENYNEVDEGIISAVSEGEGSVAIAKYQNGSLVSIDFASYEEGLTSYRANAVVSEDDGTVLKVFSFDENMNPQVSDIAPVAKENKLKVYLNENFKVYILFF